jgi:uncharacterized repeat protein (TIGR03803 family)
MFSNCVRMRKSLMCALSVAILMTAPITGFAQSESIIRRFRQLGPGSSPLAGLVSDSSGNFYGTTISGNNNAGTVFKLTLRDGRFTFLHEFTGGSPGSKDGCIPKAALIRDAAGSLYGTTAACGGTANGGIVFKVDTTGNETILHRFTGGKDGATPVASLLLDSSGNLYGTTSTGGDSSCHYYGSSGCGTIFKISAAGKFSVLHVFAGAEGASPQAGLIQGPDGNFYGTTAGGGTVLSGTVYRMTKSGNVTVLYSFSAGANPDGWQPASLLLFDSAGNLYGTTQNGGSDPNACNGFGCGSVFKLDSAGTETLLHSFTGNFDGQFPSSLVMDSAGNLYGETQGGDSVGTVFKVDPLGNETVLHVFEGGTDGQHPCCNLVMDKRGALYGTTEIGGVTPGFGGQGGGVIFKITP